MFLLLRLLLHTVLQIQTLRLDIIQQWQYFDHALQVIAMYMSNADLTTYEGGLKKPRTK